MQRIPVFVQTPMIPSLEAGIKALSQNELFHLHMLPFDVDLFPLFLEVKPCLLLISLFDLNPGETALELLKNLKEYRVNHGLMARDPTFRIILVDGDRRLPTVNWANFGVYELMMAPINPNVLDFKVTRHYHKAIAAEKKLEELVFLGETEIKKTSPEFYRFSKDAENKDEKSSWVIPRSEHHSNLKTDKIYIELQFVDLNPAEGTWTLKDQQDSHSEVWEWQNKIQSPNQTKSLRFTFEGEEPHFNSKTQNWQLLGEAPKLIQYGKSSGADPHPEQVLLETKHENEHALEVKTAPSLQIQSVKKKTYALSKADLSKSDQKKCLEPTDVSVSSSATSSHSAHDQKHSLIIETPSQETEAPASNPIKPTTNSHPQAHLAVSLPKKETQTVLNKSQVLDETLIEVPEQESKLIEPSTKESPSKPLSNIQKNAAQEESFSRSSNKTQTDFSKNTTAPPPRSSHQSQPSSLSKATETKSVPLTSHLQNKPLSQQSDSTTIDAPMKTATAFHPLGESPSPSLAKKNLSQENESFSPHQEASTPDLEILTESKKSNTEQKMVTKNLEKATESTQSKTKATAPALGAHSTSQSISPLKPSPEIQSKITTKKEEENELSFLFEDEDEMMSRAKKKKLNEEEKSQEADSQSGTQDDATPPPTSAPINSSSSSNPTPQNTLSSLTPEQKKNFLSRIFEIIFGLFLPNKTNKD